MARAAIHAAIWIDGSAAVAPGETIRGRVEGSPELVRLLRVEGSPAGDVRVPIADAKPAADGSFELVVPTGTPPTFAAPNCSISYRLRCGRDKQSRHDPTADVVVSGRLEHVSLEERGPLFDRMIARYDARHFHLELAHADVQGGGQIQGRVHLDRGEPPPVITVTVRCEEVWRVDRRSLNLKRPPLWRWEGAWMERRELEWPLGQRWIAFTFDIPVHLPPALEAPSISWRYEVEASRRTHFSMQERAVATPIGFELTL